MLKQHRSSASRVVSSTAEAEQIQTSLQQLTHPSKASVFVKRHMPPQHYSVTVGLQVHVGTCRGYTRKEPFANGIWTPKAENWNGRTAMMGFTGIVLTEALAGKSVLEVSAFV